MRRMVSEVDLLIADKMADYHTRSERYGQRTSSILLETSDRGYIAFHKDDYMISANSRGSPGLVLLALPLSADARPTRWLSLEHVPTLHGCASSHFVGLSGDNRVSYRVFHGVVVAISFE